MLQITINGEPRSFADPITIAELLRQLGYERRPVAVEVNREVVPRPKHGEQRISPGDAVEIVTLVGGGEPGQPAIWTASSLVTILSPHSPRKTEPILFSPRTRVPAVAPYFAQPCPACAGYISDSLLECLPTGKASRAADSPEGRRLRMAQAGVALACPYCNTPIGFDQSGQLIHAPAGWPLLRYSRAAVEQKMQDEGIPPGTTLEQWAVTTRFDQPGSHQPLVNYLFAEQAPSDETVP